MSSDNHLSIAFNNLKLICSIGLKITPINESYSKRARSLRTLQLENIVKKIVLHDNSIIHSFNKVKENINELDVSIIASAARNIMDIINLYFHISERKIGADEIDLRFNTMYLNAMTNLQDIYSKLNFSKDCFHASWIQMLFCVQKKKLSIQSHLSIRKKTCKLKCYLVEK